MTMKEFKKYIEIAIKSAEELYEQAKKTKCEILIIQTETKLIELKDIRKVINT